MSDATPHGVETVHVAVVIPCYNVAPHIDAVIQSMPRFVRTIIAVDDCSVDATAATLANVADARLTVLRHDANQGVGGAMRTGYRAAIARGADIVVKMDGDGQMPPEALSALLEPLIVGEADYAKGNRFHDFDALGGMPKLRLFGNSVLSFITKLVSGYWSIFDPTNGYTAIRADLLRRVDLDRLAPRYFFETSMLVELNIKGGVVADVAIPARYGEEKSALRIGTVVRQFPPLLTRSLARRFFWRYLVSDFNALTLCVLAGLPALAFGVLFGAYHWWLSVRTGVTASTGTVFLAALPIILGSQAVLVAFVLDMLYQPRRPLSRPIVAPRNAL